MSVLCNCEKDLQLQMVNGQIECVNASVENRYTKNGCYISGRQLWVLLPDTTLSHLVYGCRGFIIISVIFLRFSRPRQFFHILVLGRLSGKFGSSKQNRTSWYQGGQIGIVIDEI
jgi:hypothetical protein